MVITSLTTSEQFSEFKQMLMEDAKSNKENIHFIRLGSHQPVYTVAMTFQAGHYRLSLCGQLPVNDDIKSYRLSDGMCMIFADHLLGAEWRSDWKEVDRDQQIKEIRHFVAKAA